MQYFYVRIETHFLCCTNKKMKSNIFKNGFRNMYRIEIKNENHIVCYTYVHCTALTKQFHS